MDYEKKYKEALNLAKSYYEKEDGGANQFLDTIFPELAESEDERVIKALETFINQPEIADKITFEARILWLSWLEKQKEHEMPDSTGLIAQWDSEKEILEQKDFRDDPWRLAQNAFMDGFAYGWSIKQQKEQKSNIEICPHSIKSKSYSVQPVMTEEMLEGKLEQKPAEPQDYSGLNDIERAIHRGFLAAGVENVPVGIIKETAKECLAQMKPAEWSDTNELVFKDICKHLKEEGYNGWIVLLNVLHNGEFQPKQELGKED